jgi:hypothetical protein
MTPIEELISEDTFIFYADYFALAARCGIESAQALFPLAADVLKVDVRTFSYFEEAFSVRNTFVVNLQSSYNQVFINAFSLEPMRDAFIHLSDHIKKFSGLTVDNYLSENGLKVDRTYANLSEFTGNLISNSNIR